jgi:two-component sensor histidine kinase
MDTSDRKRHIFCLMDHFLYLNRSAIKLKKCALVHAELEYQHDNAPEAQNILKRLILVVLFWGVARSGWSQGNPADIPSLMTRLAFSKPDTQRINIFIGLAASYVVPGRAPGRTDSAASYLKKARDLNEVFQIPAFRDKIDMISAYLHCLLFSSDDPRTAFLPVIDTCRKTGDKATEAQTWMYLGSTIDEDKTSNAYKLACYQNGLTLTRQSGDRFTELRLERLIAHIHVLQNKFEEAELELSGLLWKAKKAGLGILMYTDGELTFLYLSKGELNNALRYAFETQRVMGLTRDSTSADDFFHQMISIYGALGKFTQRDEWGKRDLEFKLATNNIRGVYSDIEAVCDLMRYVGDPRSVLGFIRKKLALQPPTGLNDQRRVQHVLGDAYLYDKNYVLAGKCYREMIRIGDLQTNGYSLFDHAFDDYKMGKFYYDLGVYRKARPFLEKSTKEFEAYGVLPYTRYNNELLYRIDSATGNYAAAFRHLKEFNRIGDSIFRADRNRQIEELQVAYQTEQKDKSIRLLEGQEQLERLQLRHSKSVQNWIILVAGMFLVIAALLYRQAQIRKKNSRAVVAKNKQLQELVEEKDWLVKEIHHRVKNNLQTIMSLLELPADSICMDPLSAIQASQNRIFATSLLHQKLYQGNNMSSVNMGVYIPELIHYLREVFQTGRQIELKTRIEPIDLDISQAVPIGIIINEVVTNAIKHAFPSRPEKASIRIFLRMIDENMALLKITDNGIGVPPEFVERKPGLGLRLVSELTKDIDGVVEMVSNPGTTVSIRFTPRPILIQVKEVE